jgi:hypothetical protein
MAAPIPEINYAGISLDEKFRWMQAGHGVEGVDPAVRTLAALAPELEASADHINRALPEGVTWRGAAATAATGSLWHTAQRTQQAGQASKLGGSLVGDYARVFADSKSRIAKPVEQSWFSKVTDYFGLTDDYAGIAKQNRALDDAANRAMKAYEVQARTSLASFPDPTTPPPPGGRPAGTPPPAAPAPTRSAPTAPRTAPGGPGGATPGGSPRATPLDTPNRPSPPTPPAAALPPNPGLGTQQTAPPTTSPGWTPLPERPGTSPPTGTGMAPFPSPSPGAGLSSRPDSSDSLRRGSAQSPLPRRPSGVERTAGPGLDWTGSPAGTPASKPPGPGGAMPPLITGRGNRDTDGHFHRNGVYIPSDEPFVVKFDDDVLPGHVLGGEDTP